MVPMEKRHNKAAVRENTSIDNTTILVCNDL